MKPICYINPDMAKILTDILRSNGYITWDGSSAGCDDDSFLKHYHCAFKTGAQVEEAYEMLQKDVVGQYHNVTLTTLFPTLPSAATAALPPPLQSAFVPQPLQPVPLPTTVPATGHTVNGEHVPQSVQFTCDERMAVRQEIAALKGFTVRALLAKKDQQKTNQDFR